jgi:hypothetical protein
MPARTEAFTKGFRFVFKEDPIYALHSFSGATPQGAIYLQ